MEILPEIIETSDKMINVLEKNGFFNDNHMLNTNQLKYALQVAMQRKWEQENEMILTDIEFLKVCNDEIGKSIGETLQSLVEKGAINMGVDSNGEIVYSINPEFDTFKLSED